MDAEVININRLLNYLLASSQQFLSDTVVSDFKQLKADHERVDFAYKYISVSPMVDGIMFPQRVLKCNRKSQALRERGNEMFCYKRHTEALQLYTESIAFAEGGSCYLGLAYANRSAVLFEKGYYKQCLEDINRAFNNNYPIHLREKLLVRQLRAQFGGKPKEIRYYAIMPAVSKRHPHILASADCLEFQENDHYGTHVITTRDVEAGEILSVEKPFVSDVLSQSKFLHCHECLELCLNLIPCTRCATALYCSMECRMSAYTFYHRYECDFGCTVENKLLAVKITLLCAMEHRYNARNDSSADKTYRSDRFKELLTLETNETMMDDLHRFMFSAVAGILFHNLKNRTCFIEENSLDENMLKNMFFRNILIETGNSMEIEKVMFVPGYIGTKPTSVGRGIYAFTGRINHSCSPNCLRIAYGSSFVVRALRDIKKGEQCTFTYGCTYYRNNLAERQALLKRNFFFTCRCVACENSWPTYDNFHMGRDFEEAIAQIASLARRAQASWFANEVCRMAVVMSTDATKIDTDELLSKCFRLQAFLTEPCKAMVHIRNLIHHLLHIPGNQDVTF